jgi:hypothetical protein
MIGLRIWLFVILFTYYLESFMLRTGKQLDLRARRIATTTSNSDSSKHIAEGAYPKKRRSSHIHTSDSRKATMEQVLHNCVDNSDSTAMTLDEVNRYSVPCGHHVLVR